MGRVLDREQYLREWSRLHGQVPPAGLVGGWLRLSHRLAGPLAVRGVPPAAVTVAGLVLAASALAPAAAGGAWPLLAVLLIVLSALADGMDGAVAVLQERVTARGAVLDATCDRLSDVCLVAALALAGAPLGWCLAAALLALMHEQIRANARASGMTEVGVVTVAERPTRVIVAASFLLGAGLYPAAASGWALAGAVVWVGAGVAGLGQLAVVVGRRLG